MDTIFAQATARGKAGVAIIRISGPRAWEGAAALAGPLPAVREAGLRRLALGGELLDQALVLCFEAGASFTGERVVEFHLHGALATVAAVLRALSVQEGFRLAAPGEFTRRALENGCLDLAQVEGLADLIEAETEAQRKQALAVLSGAVGALVESWRVKLLRSAALLEATIDFADEEVPEDVMPEVSHLLAEVLAQLKREAGRVSAAERVREGFEVAIVGRPNVGKSTLLNALAGREAAITSEIAGTTRDVIEVRMDIGGLAVTLLDTAGLRETEDSIEALGVDLALRRAKQADLRIFLVAGELPPELEPDEDDLVVFGKADLHKGTGLSVSGKTGEGLEQLLGALEERLLRRVSGAGVMTRARHRDSLLDAVAALECAVAEATFGVERSEMVAEHLRHAARSLEALLGRVDVENLLDEIFSSFCIGK